MKISVVIITYNEERNIGRCLESLGAVADEVVVVDSFSEDKTKEICEIYKVRFVEHVFDGHIQQKNYALELAKNDWVLSLDADEALTDELRDSICIAKKTDDVDAWELKRLTNFCGKWIKHAGWYPDKKIRLWKKSIGQWGGQNPHDRVVLSEEAKIGKLTGDLLHYSFYSISEHIQQIQKFSTIAAESAYANGNRANLFANILLGPFYTFFKKYILQAGFMDGYFGFIISVNTAYSKYLKYVKLRELQKGQK
ncbi:MAG: glycosyltransferase family 2 protein [Cytophagales bacterium]|nr:glycosyltransferase family 2 protein [Cytophagales bacterium]